MELHGKSSTALRLPKGKTYSVGGFLFDEAYTEGTVVGLPEVVLTTQRDAVIDARKAKPVTISAPSRSARMLSNEFGTIGLSDDLFSVNLPGAIGGDRIEGLYAAPTAKVKDSKFAYLVSSIWAEPADHGANPSSVYYLTRPVFGAIPADPAYNPRKSDLAEVNSTFAATAPGAPAFRFVYTHVGNVRFGGHMMKGVRSRAGASTTSRAVRACAGRRASTNSTSWIRPARTARCTSVPCTATRPAPRSRSAGTRVCRPWGSRPRG